MAWDCPNCGTEIESQFKVCWNCGTDIHGNVDENFAIDVDPDHLEENPEIPRVRCQKCNYQGKVLFSTQYKTWGEWIVAGVISSLFSQRSWIHFCHKVCPQCGADQEELVPWSGEISEKAESAWVRASKREARNARKNRMLVYLIFASIFAASYVLWYATR